MMIIRQKDDFIRSGGSDDSVFYHQCFLLVVIKMACGFLQRILQYLTILYSLQILPTEFALWIWK